jgi:hypothetical protein
MLFNIFSNALETSTFLQFFFILDRMFYYGNIFIRKLSFFG